MIIPVPNKQDSNIALLNSCDPLDSSISSWINFSIRLASVVAGLICAISGNGAEPFLTASSPSSSLSEPKNSLSSCSPVNVAPFGNSLPSPSNPTKDICSGDIDGCDWSGPPSILGPEFCRFSPTGLR